MLVPGSIDATGADDVTQELVSFISSVPAGGTVTFPPTGEYRCEGTFLIGAKTDITLDFGGALIFATTPGVRTRAHIRVTGSKGVRLIRPRVRGVNPYSGLDARAYNPDFEAQHGIEVWSSAGVIIDHPEVRSVYGDFYYIGRKSPHNPWCSWVNLISPYGRDNGRIGMSIIAGHTIGVRDVDFDRMRRSVFDFEPDSNSDGATNVMVTGGRIGRSHTGYLLASKGSAGLITNVTIKNLHLVDHVVNAMVVSPEGLNPATGLPWRTKKNITIMDCDSNQTSQITPMRFTRVDGVTVKRIKQPMKVGVPLVITNDCTGVVLE